MPGPTLKAARQSCTKKNSVTSFTDDIRELLGDANVGADRLKESKTTLTELWREYSTAFDVLEGKLVEEDGDDGELDTVTGAFGAAEKGYRKALGNLTDAIEKKAKSNAETAAAEQERVDEAERQRAVREQQLEQARQVPVMKQQIKVMYKEAVDAMKKTAELIDGMGEPSLPEINAREQELKHAYGIMEQAEETAKNLASVVPEEVVQIETDRIKAKAEVMELQRACNTKIAHILAANPEIQNAKDAAGGANRQSVKANPTSAIGGYRYERRKLPEYLCGSLRKFPTFKDDWQNQVAEFLSEKDQLIEIRTRVPDRVRVQVEKSKTMKEVWGILTDEYGKPEELIKDRLAHLCGYHHPKEARTDPQKVLAMHQRFTEVYSDMDKSDALTMLNHPASLQAFMKNLPLSCVREYVLYKEQRVQQDEGELQVVKGFLELEKKRQKSVQELLGKNRDDRAGETEVKSKDDRLKDITCRKCNKKGHFARDCKSEDRHVVKSHASVQDGGTQRPQVIKPSCPVCKQKHGFTNSQGKEKNSTRFSNCEDFMDKTPEEKAKVLEDVSGCVRCLDWTGGHQVDRCTASSFAVRQCTRQGCTKKHNPLLHNATNPYVNHMGKSLLRGGRQAQSVQRPLTAVVTVHLERGAEFDRPPTQSELAQQDLEAQHTMFLVDNIPVQKGGSGKEIVMAKALYDGASNGTMVRTAFAEQLVLKGRAVRHMLVRTGGDTVDWNTSAYFIRLVTRDGLLKVVVALGVTKISSCLGPVDVRPAIEEFPQVGGVACVKRPEGELDLLIGYNYMELHPKEIARKGGLALWETSFSDGKLISGTHPRIRLGAPEEMDSSTREISLSLVLASYKVHHTSLEVQRFMEGEEMGVGQPSRCDNCKNCSRCTFRAQHMSRREAAELVLIEQNIEIDEDTNRVYFSYPTTGDLAQLKDNRMQAIACETSWERKVDLMGKRKDYNQEVAGYVERGTFVRLSEEEMDSWKGAVNYISHHGVLKPSSITTSLRVVSNSSLRNNRSGGLSLNDLLVKGPNSILPIVEVQVYFRTLNEIVVWDYQKAYNTVWTTPREMHVRRLVWRDSKEDRWDTYGIRKMHFGDKCAAAGLEVSKNKTADKGADIDPVAAEAIKRGYVDDGLGGGTKEVVDRMVGTETYHKETKSWTYTGTVPKIMAGGGFKLKYMLRNGETRPEVLELYSGSMLGLPWNPTSDRIVMRVEVNLSVKKQGVRIGPPVTADTLHLIYECELTRRIFMSQVHGVFDSLGLLSPVMIRYRLTLQKIVLAELGWDEALTGELLQEAQEILVEMVLLGEVSFPRCVFGEEYEKGWSLLGFWDGGKPASACCLYARTKRSRPGPAGESHEVHLLAGKARVTPTSGAHGRQRASTPRTEMRGALLMSRLAGSILPGCAKLPDEIQFFGDSQSTISCLEADDRVLDIWMMNRVAEIRDRMEEWQRQGIKVLPVHWWPGPQNVADIGTKGLAKVSDIAEDSEWQNGPRCLSFGRETWPASREFTRAIPEGEGRVEIVSHLGRFLSVEPGTQVEGGDIQLIVKGVQQILKRASNLSRAIGSVARLLQAQKLLKLKQETDVMTALTREPGDALRRKAERLVYAVAAMEVTPLVGKFKNLDPVLERQVWVTKGGRLGVRGLHKLTGQDALPLVLKDSDLARLIMLKAHAKNHAKADGTLGESRTMAWIPQGRYLARDVAKNCLLCRVKDAKKFERRLEQRMGDLPPERYEIGARPFHAICLDLLGPLWVKSMVNRRAKMKAWPVLFVCQATGALHIEVMHNYGTQAFLLQWGRFSAIRGDPKVVVSDRGSQLTSTKNTVAFSEAEAPRNWDWDEVERLGAVGGTEWRWVPAGSQFRNGLSERRVAVIKDTLHHMLANTMIGDKPTLDYAEACTLFARIANTINDRPIGLKSSTLDEMVPLTVNQLILGRTSSVKPPDLDVVEEGYMAADTYLQELVQCWWKLWRDKAVPTLMPYHKWEMSKRHRNLVVGDVCLLQFDSKVISTYKLCRVVEIKKSTDKCVRTVTVGYLPQNKLKTSTYNPKTLETKEVAIQRLALIVPVEEIDGVRK